MGIIQENKITPEWVEDLYQIEMADPVVGGADGVANKQAKQLAQRTQFLRRETERLKNQKAGIGKIGFVQLSSDIESENEDTAATLKAVSLVNEKVEEVAKSLRNYLVLGGIVALREVSDEDVRIVQLDSYYAGGTTGGGLFVADSSDLTSVDNGGTVIVSSNGTRWKRVDTPKIQDFGAHADGISDDVSAFNSAIRAAVPVYVPAGTYYVSANVFGGNLWTDGPVVFVGAYAASVPNIKDQTASRLRAVCADMAAGKPIKIACYGDSTTDGNATTGWTQNPVDAAGQAVGQIDHESTAPNAWPAKLKTILRDMYKNDNIAVYNAGYSGRRMSNGWAYRNYDQAITNNPSYGKPDLCFIGFGLNDIADADFSVSKFCQNLELLLQKMLAVGTVPVVLACDAHRRGGGNVRDRARSSRQLDEGKRALCEQYGVPYFAIDEAEKDFWEKNADGHQWWAGMIDGLHYGDVGHAFKASWVAAQLYKDVYRYDGTSQVLENLDSRNSFGGDYNASYNMTRGRLGHNVTWSAANVKTGDAIVEAWIWVEDPQAKLIYRGIDNESIDAGIFDASKLPAVLVRNAVLGEIRYTPSNVGAARVIETSAVGDEPTLHRMVDMPYIVGHLPYGLNKVQYLTSGPRDDNLLSGYCGYFDLISSPHQDGAPKNVLMHCGPIVLNNSQDQDSKSLKNIHNQKVMVYIKRIIKRIWCRYTATVPLTLLPSKTVNLH